MSNIRRRLDRLEERHLESDEERPMEKGGRLPARVHDAQRSNERWLAEGKEPLFVLVEEGQIYTRDGHPVTECHQTLAEEFYWMEVERGGPGLVHDEEAEEFYTPEGELALSRTYCNLQCVLNC